MALPDGLYDLLLTEGLARSLAALGASGVDVAALKGGASEVLADVISRQLASILEDLGGDDSEKPRRQLELVNDLLVMLRRRLTGGHPSIARPALARLMSAAPTCRVPHSPAGWSGPSS